MLESRLRRVLLQTCRPLQPHQRVLGQRSGRVIYRRRDRGRGDGLSGRVAEREGGGGAIIRTASVWFLPGERVRAPELTKDTMRLPHER